MKRAGDVPRVGAAHHVSDRPSRIRLADRAVRSLVVLERLGFEDVVAGEVGEDDHLRVVRERVIGEHAQFLLRTEPGRAVVLHGQTRRPLDQAGPRRGVLDRHRVGERIAERGDVDPLARARVAESLGVGLEPEPAQRAVADAPPG